MEYNRSTTTCFHELPTNKKEAYFSKLASDAYRISSNHSHMVRKHMVRKLKKFNY